MEREVKAHGNSRFSHPAGEMHTMWKAQGRYRRAWAPCPHLTVQAQSSASLQELVLHMNVTFFAQWQKLNQTPGSCDSWHDIVACWQILKSH